LVFGSIQFHLLTHSLPILMGILPSWIHQFHKRIFEVSWSAPPVFPLVIFVYYEPLFGWRQGCYELTCDIVFQSLFLPCSSSTYVTYLRRLTVFYETWLTNLVQFRIPLEPCLRKI